MNILGFRVRRKLEQNEPKLLKKSCTALVASQELIPIMIGNNGNQKLPSVLNQSYLQINPVSPYRNKDRVQPNTVIKRLLIDQRTRRFHIVIFQNLLTRASGRHSASRSIQISQPIRIFPELLYSRLNNIILKTDLIHRQIRNLMCPQICG